MAGELMQVLQPEKVEQSLRTPVARGAWKVLGGLIAAALLVLGVIQAVVGLAHEEYTEVDTFPADDVAMLDVRNSAGGVTIRGSDSNSDEITVTARISHGLRRTGHRESLQGDRLVLDTSCPIFLSSFCDVRYTIDVPTDIDVVVRDAGGSVNVNDVTGDVDLNSDSGGVDVARIGGGLLRIDSDAGSVTATDVRSSDVEATSDAGGVYVGFARPPQAVWADSDAGGVEIVLPDGDEAYDVEADSDAGGVEIDVADDPRSPRTVRATSDAGGVTVRYGVG